MTQMEAQQDDEGEIISKEAGWVEYFQEGTFPLEGGNDYEGEVLHELPSKMKITGEHFTYRLAIQIKFKGITGGKLLCYLPLYVVDANEWERLRNARKDKQQQSSDTSSNGKKNEKKKKGEGDKKKSESESESKTESGRDSDTNDEGKKKEEEASSSGDSDKDEKKKKKKKKK